MSARDYEEIRRAAGSDKIRVVCAETQLRSGFVETHLKIGGFHVTEINHSSQELLHNVSDISNEMLTL
jgi:hypothetical protein